MITPYKKFGSKCIYVIIEMHIQAQHMLYSLIMFKLRVIKTVITLENTNIIYYSFSNYVALLQSHVNINHNFQECHKYFQTAHKF